MQPPTTSSRRTWKAYPSGAWCPRPPGCGLPCAKLTIFPLIQSVWGCRDFPHSEGHLAWKRTVGGALNIWEDSSSLGLAHGTAQLSWLCPGVTRGEAKLDLLLIEPLRTQWTARDFAPDNIFGLVAFIEHNAESMVDLAELWDVWRTWQSPRRRWRDPSMVPIPADLVAWRAPRARAVRSLWGWLGAMEAGGTLAALQGLWTADT